MLNDGKANKQNSKINRHKSLLYLCAFVVMLPFIGAFPGLDVIKLNVFGYLIPSQVIIVAACAAFFMIASIVVPGNNKSSTERIVLPLMILFFAMGLWGLIRAWLADVAIQQVFLQILWIIAPLLFAGLFVGIVKKSGISFSVLSEVVILGMALFSCVLIGYNIGAYGFGLVDGRLYCPGLGPVILGYTNALVIALAVSRKHSNSYIPAPILALAVLILLGSTFLTGSRGGIYPALILSLIYFLPSRNASAIVLFFLGAIIILIALNPIEAFLSGRAGNLQSGRYATWDAAFMAFCDGSLLNQLFGYGLGNVFPYQDWYTSISSGAIVRGYTDGTWNSFSFHGNVMLVEPHNTYIWFLLEGGIISLLGFIFCLLSILIISVSNKFSRLRVGVVLVTFMALGIFDAVIFINMASAFWWSILFITLEAENEFKGDLV